MSFFCYWPVESSVITQRFGARPEYYAQFGLPSHEGLDLRARQGSKVFACQDGVVTLVDPSNDTSRRAYGNYVVIDHGDYDGHKYETGYAHLQDSTVGVKVGQFVKAGTVIALADNTGNSSAAHLHLNLLRDGVLVDPQPYLEPFPRDAVPTHPLRGLHGDGATDWLFREGVKGWGVEAIYSGPTYTPLTLDFSYAPHIRTVVRLNYSWAVGDGGLGTYPKRAERDDFVDWCVNTIQSSKGCHAYILGNEPNNPREWPDDTPIYPADVAYVVNGVWNRVAQEIRVGPPAVDPVNAVAYFQHPGFPEPLEYFRQMIADLDGMEMVPLHSYAYASTDLPSSSVKFGDDPLRYQYHGFRMWEPFAAHLYETRYRRLPILITETSHLYKKNGGIGWDNDADGVKWIERMYEFVRGWNSVPGDAYCHGCALYRYKADAWRLDDKPLLLDALKRSGEKAIIN